jgi:phospholipid-transporting ATPase
MSADFVRLVTQANPSAQLHSNPSNSAHGYPPVIPPYSDQSPVGMDPFFDDDDVDVPDSAFGRPAMQSQESGLPLSQGAVPPAGHSKVSLPAQGAHPGGWTFDDDMEGQFSQSGAFPGPSTPVRGQQRTLKKGKRRWKWPWQKEVVLQGERIIVLNNEDANSEYLTNIVSTSKYNMATFVPKFLTGESEPVRFHYSNAKCFFFHR